MLPFLRCARARRARAWRVMRVWHVVRVCGAWHTWICFVGARCGTRVRCVGTGVRVRVACRACAVRVMWFVGVSLRGNIVTASATHKRGVGTGVPDGPFCDSALTNGGVVGGIHECPFAVGAGKQNGAIRESPLHTRRKFHQHPTMDRRGRRSLHVVGQAAKGNSKISQRQEQAPALRSRRKLHQHPTESCRDASPYTWLGKQPKIINRFGGGRQR